MGLSPAESQACLEAALEIGMWEFGDFTFASGAKANNKLDAERILTSKRRDFILGSMTKLVLRLEPDVLWGPDRGGQDFAREIAWDLGIPYARMRKVSTAPGNKTFDYESEEDMRLILEADCATGVEDVTTRLTTLGSALRLPGMLEKTKGIVAFWRRGDPAQELSLGVPIDWVVEEEVPNIITPDHPFYEKYNHLASGELPS